MPVYLMMKWSVMAPGEGCVCDCLVEEVSDDPVLVNILVFRS